MTQWWIGAFVVMLAAALGYYIRLIIGRYAVKSSEQDSSRMLSDARREAESIRQGAGLQAKEAVLKAREEFEANIKTRRQEIATFTPALTYAKIRRTANRKPHSPTQNTAAPYPTTQLPRLSGKSSPLLR